MKKFWLCLFFALSAGIIGATSLLYGAPVSGVQELNWIQNTIGTKDIQTLPFGELAPYSINGNIDCQKQRVTTRPARPLQSAETTDTCVVNSAFGSISASNLLQRQGTNTAGTVTKLTGEGAQLIGIPHSTNMLYIGSFVGNGNYLFILRDAQNHIQSEANIRGEVKHTLSKAGAILADLSQTSLLFRYESVSFSPNGEWMVADIPFVGVSRVHLPTGAVLPFGPAINYSLGLSPAWQTAITNDGRYAAIGSSSFNNYTLYDLSTCSIPEVRLTKAANCLSRDLGSAFRQGLSEFRSAGTLRFSQNNVLTFYVSHVVGSQTLVSKRLVYIGAEPATTQAYIGLGDSFASGEGAFDYKVITDTSDNKCHTSLSSYPYLIGSSLSLGSVESVACSGAVQDDVTSESEAYQGQTKNRVAIGLRPDRQEYLANFYPGYESQSGFIQKYQPATVTLSVGGNDIGFSDIIKRCLMPDTCYDKLEDRTELLQAMDSLFYQLSSTYTQLKLANYSDSTLYVVGYPQIVMSGGNCALNVHLNNQEIEFAILATEYLNSVIALAAAHAGVSYIDVSESIYGHRLCEASGKSVAVNGLTAGKDVVDFGFIRGPIGNESYHPNALGHQLMAETILEASQDFTLKNPAPEPGLSTQNLQPPEAFLSVPPANRLLRKVFVPRRLPTISEPTETLTTYFDQVFKPGTSVETWINSTPTHLGTTIYGAGVTQQSYQVPTSIEMGYHTIHNYGVNALGEPIDVMSTVYIGDPTDTACSFVGLSGVDEDRDGTDDACDALIELVDTQAPVVHANLPTPNEHGWYNNDIQIEWAAIDLPEGSPSPTQPGSTLANIEGEHNYTSSPSCDARHNCAAGTATLKIDKTAPVVNSISLNPSTITTNEVVGVSLEITELHSAVQKVEYTIDSSETPTIITDTGSEINFQFTANLPPGAHSVSARVQDFAGNWSIKSSASFVVKDPMPSAVDVRALLLPKPGAHEKRAYISAYIQTNKMGGSSTGYVSLRQSSSHACRHHYLRLCDHAALYSTNIKPLQIGAQKGTAIIEGSGVFYHKGRLRPVLFRLSLLDGSISNSAVSSKVGIDVYSRKVGGLQGELLQHIEYRDIDRGHVTFSY